MQLAHSLESEIEQIYRQISNLERGQRHRLQPQLAGLIDRLRAHEEPVPPELHRLNEELLEEAIEAQFDNMPV